MKLISGTMMMMMMMMMMMVMMMICDDDEDNDDMLMMIISDSVTNEALSARKKRGETFCFLHYSHDIIFCIDSAQLHEMPIFLKAYSYLYLYLLISQTQWSTP